jgi:hypothetical protein
MRPAEMTGSRHEPLRTLLEAIASQIAEIEADLKALYGGAFVETAASSVRFGDAFSGARPPAGVENVSAGYSSGLGERGNEPADLAVTLVELLAQAADVLAEMQDRVAEEGYLDTSRVQWPRRGRLIDVAIGALVGIAACQAAGCWRILSRHLKHR